jgi:hypothetical protein
LLAFPPFADAPLLAPFAAVPPCAAGFVVVGVVGEGFGGAALAAGAIMAAAEERMMAAARSGIEQRRDRM